MVTAKDLHNQHTALMSEILFLKDEIHFIKDVIYQRSSIAENNFQKEKLEDFLEDAGQLVAGLDEIEMNSKSVEHRVKELLETGTVQSEDPVFQEVNGIADNFNTQELKLKDLKKELFKLN